MILFIHNTEKQQVFRLFTKEGTLVVFRGG